MTDARATDKPSLADVIREAVEAETREMHTHATARVLRYDADKQLAQVAITIRYREQDPDSEGYEYELPDPIDNVPVQWPTGNTENADFVDSKPLRRGSEVTLHFGERSLDEWLNQGLDDTEPKDPRVFDISDAIAFPGHRPFNRAISGLPADRAHYGDPQGFRVSIADNGRGKIGTAANDLLEVMSANLGTQSTLFGALQTGFTALQTGFTAVGTYAGVVAGADPVPAIATAAGTLGTAAGVAASACGVAASACGTAKTAVDGQRTQIDAIKG